jgi:hypothetical protein
VKQALEMATIGAAIGLFGAWASQRFTSGLLFGISPVDPVTFVGTAVILLAVAAIASAIPAARVLRIDPAGALRQDWDREERGSERIVGNSEVIVSRFLAESWIGVEKSAYHQLSHTEIGSDNPCSQQLSGDNEEIGDPTRLAGSNRPE